MNYANGVLLEENIQLKKVLRIIKEKEVNVEDFIYACKCSRKELKEHHNCSNNYELACSCVGCDKEDLTQAEFELLKEHLY